MTSRRVVVTGAAAGIGRALVEAFAAGGAYVIGVDVDEAGLADARSMLATAGGTVHSLCADLSRPSEAERLAGEIAELGPVHTVVHNAGINCSGPFAGMDPDAARRVVAVNLTAPMLLTGALLRREALEDGGALVFVSSLSRFVGYPGAAVYAATKDGLASYARSLAVALAPRGVHVLTVYPGPTRTAHARLHSPPGSPEDRRMPPEELARRILRAMRKRRRVLVPGVGNWVFAMLGHALPRVTERALKRALFDKLVVAQTKSDERVAETH